MRLDRYIGDPPKFKVQRRQEDGSYADVEPFDYFVIALKDQLAPAAFNAYAQEAQQQGDGELALDMLALANEAQNRPDRKMPD